MPFNTSLFFSFFYSSSHQSWESFVLFWYLLSWKSLKEAMQRGEVIYVIHHICKISKNWLRRKLFTRFSSFIKDANFSAWNTYMIIHGWPFMFYRKSFVLSTLGFTCVAFVTGALALWAPSYMFNVIKAQGQDADEGKWVVVWWIMIKQFPPKSLQRSWYQNHGWNQ